MNNIQISEEAYQEFKGFLEENKVEDYNLRISYLGRNCSGPTFNIDISKPKVSDTMEQVKEIKFYIEEKIINDYGGLIVLSNNENGGKGLELKPVKDPLGGCKLCVGC